MNSIKIVFGFTDNVNKFVKICEKYSEEIDVSAGRYIVNGKSILGLLSLNLLDDATVTIHTDNIFTAERFINEVKGLSRGDR